MRDFNFTVNGYEFDYHNGELLIDDSYWDEGDSPEMVAIIEAYLDLKEKVEGKLP